MIIKPVDQQNENIDRLQALLLRSDLTLKQQKHLRLELSKMRQGHQAEKNAAFMLAELAANSGRMLINDLRLEDGDYVAQIDHLFLNRFGAVELFETKSFSTGLKVDEDEHFFRWDAYQKRYVEIPSPIEQSRRHERLLRQALEQLGYKVAFVEHFVIVDYNAKLINEHKHPYLCRPDQVEKAIKGRVDSLSALTILKGAGRALLNRFTQSEMDIEQIAYGLVKRHQPKQIDYIAKFGLPAEEEAPMMLSTAQPKSKTQSNPKMKVANQASIEKGFVMPAAVEKTSSSASDLFTGTELVKRLKLASVKELEASLAESGLLRKTDKGYYEITSLGKAEGIQLKRGRHGYYFLYPDVFAEEAAS